MKFFDWKRRSLAFVLVALLITAAGCSKDDDNPVNPGDNTDGDGSLVGSGTITLNGDGFTNKVINFPAALASYYTGDAQTVIGMSMATATDTANVGIFFAGKQTGTYNFSNSQTNQFNEVYIAIGTQKAYISSSTGSVKITEYGAVGGFIKGTIEGTFENAGTQTQITITGSFTALRGSDSD